MLPLSIKLRALQDAQDARAADDAAGPSECAGYAVWDEDGRIGTVIDTHLERSRSPVRPSLLAVRTGLFRRRIVLISETEIEHRDSSRRRVTLKPRVRRAQTAVAAADDVVAYLRPSL